MNHDLNLAHKIVEHTGANLFLTGKAGTGKTTFLHRLRESAAKNMVVLAPTGVAAINARGATIHSFFQLSFAPFIPGHGYVSKENVRYSFSKQKRRIIASLDLLVIDEISMVRPDVLDAIDSVLRRYRDPQSPFGGVQLLLIGDLRQLAPVVKDSEWEILRDYYASPYFFESQALRKAGYLAIELQTVYRQNDPEFIEILNAVRDGNPSDEMIRNLNMRFRPSFDPPETEGYIRLTTHNHLAQSLNDSRLKALSSPLAVIKADLSGNFPESSFPAESDLMLKTGAQVMFIKNDSGTERRFYNGMIGHVTAISDSSGTVAPSDGSPQIEVGKALWENTRYEIDEKNKSVKEVVDGTFLQFPLRLAWAITIHKSQGLTFDKAIIDAASSFAPGQAYVALSRCRSLDGLVLSSRLDSNAVIIDKNVNTFITGCNEARPDDATVASLQSEYNRFLLAELFSFKSVIMPFSEFFRAVEEYVVPIHPSIWHDYKAASEMIHNEIEAVGMRFIRIYASKPISSDSLASDTAMIDKINNGCRYFTERLKKIFSLVNSTPRSIDNARYATRLNNAADSLLFALNVKQLVLFKMASRPFSASEYTKAKAEATLSIYPDASPGKKNRKRADKTRDKKIECDSGSAVKQRSVVDTNTASEKIPIAENKNSAKEKRSVKKEGNTKKPKGYSQHETLKLFRSGINPEDIAKMRELSPLTIAGHLADSVSDNLLPEAELIALYAHDMRILSEQHMANPDLPKGDFCKMMREQVSPVALTIFTRLKYNNPI